MTGSRLQARLDQMKDKYEYLIYLLRGWEEDQLFIVFPDGMTAVASKQQHKGFDESYHVRPESTENPAFTVFPPEDECSEWLGFQDDCEVIDLRPLSIKDMTFSLSASDIERVLWVWEEVRKLGLDASYP